MNEGRTFFSDVYFHPEACGLRLIGQVEDENSCYSFDTVIVVQDVETGAVYAAHDSGCSCPTPFEDVRSLADMSLIRTVADIRGFVDAVAPQRGLFYSPNWPEEARTALYRKVEVVLTPC